MGPLQQVVLVSLVERKSRYVLLKKVANKSADVVHAALCKMLQPIKVRVKTVTSDKGKEFAAHEQLDAQIGCMSYFAKPYYSWQRGTNENTNGLVRQYIPNWRRLNSVTHEELQTIQDLLNHRPRKCLGFKTRHVVFH